MGDSVLLNLEMETFSYNFSIQLGPCKLIMAGEWYLVHWVVYASYESLLMLLLLKLIMFWLQIYVYFILIQILLVFTYYALNLKRLIQVTWIEHTEYDESIVHHSYRTLVRTGIAFGAQKWLSNLQRQCELFSSIMSSPASPSDHSGTTSIRASEINWRELQRSY